MQCTNDLAVGMLNDMDHKGHVLSAKLKRKKGPTYTKSSSLKGTQVLLAKAKICGQVFMLPMANV